METEKFTGISSFFSPIQNNYEFEFSSKKDFYCKLTVVVYSDRVREETQVH